MEAEDNAARYPGIGQAQLARHTAEVEIRMPVDAVAPAVQVDLADLPAAGADDLLNGATTLSGDITERPVPLNIAWETGAQGEQASLAMRAMDRRSTPSQRARWNRAPPTPGAATFTRARRARSPRRRAI